MKVIGLTGGIASGKSTASRYFLQNGLPVLDADIMAREVVLPGMPALKEIAKTFGQDMLLVTGELDRKALGELVFNQPAALEELNRIMHPRIRERLTDALEGIRESKTYSAVIIDAALLLEAGWGSIVDEVWLLVVDPQRQIDRLMHRNQITRSEASRLVDLQMSLEDKKEQAKIWIENNGQLSDLYHQLDELILTIT